MAVSNCSCIIPVFNEGGRVLKVLAAVAQVSTIDEVICIDDGSNDDSAALIKQHYPSVKLIRLPNNMGKTEAVRRGLLATNSQYVLLLDADLRNLSPAELEAAIKAMQQDPRIDMLVLRRVTAPWNIKLFRGDVLIPGERIIKADDLHKAIATQKPKQFQLEFAINKYMMDGCKTVYWVPSSAKNTWPTAKLNFMKGLVKIASMQMDILRYIGLGGYMKQLIFFCRQRLKKIVAG